MRTVAMVEIGLESDDTGKYSLLTTDSGFTCYTLERPNGIMSHPPVPKGVYEVSIQPHPIHGDCYQLKTGEGTPAPNRTAILIHSANWYQQLLGCIALGRQIATIEGEYIGLYMKQKGVISSKDAISAFMDDLKGEPFTLTIS